MGKVKQENIGDVVSLFDGPTRKQRELMSDALDRITEMNDPMDMIIIHDSVAKMLEVINLMPALVRADEQDTLCYVLLEKLVHGMRIGMKKFEIEMAGRLEEADVSDEELDPREGISYYDLAAKAKQRERLRDGGNKCDGEE